MKTAHLILLLCGTLATGIALGAGGVYVARAPSLPAPAPAAAPSQEMPAPRASSNDAERAREGVKSGAFLPLETVTEKVRARFPGEVLGVKLSEDDGETFYEFRVLTKNGRLIEVEIDPRTGAILDIDDD